MRSKLYAVVMWIPAIAWLCAYVLVLSKSVMPFLIGVSWVWLGVYFWRGGGYKVEDWIKRHLP